MAFIDDSWFLGQGQPGRWMMAAMRTMAESPSLAHTHLVGISVSLGDSVSFVDGVAFGLLTAVLAALVWANPPTKFRDPVTIFTGVLALATSALVYVSWLQQRTLDKQTQTMEMTDKTMRAGERAFVFVTHSIAGWQPAKTINGEIVRDYPVVWENSGNSPTRDLAVKLYCLPLGPLTIENPIASIDKAKQLQLLLGPKQTSWGGTCTYSTKLLKLVRDNAYHLYIVASANYFDIFDEPHKTEACVELINISGDFEDLQATPRTDLSNCGRNCADKECDKP